MSRYSIAGKAGATKVDLGWDRPLKTFYVQVFAHDPENEGEESAIIWVGTEPRVLPSAAAAISIAEAHADLPKTFGATLEIDRLRTVAAADGPAQISAKRFLNF